jgi:hypothetical protein
MDRRKGVEGRRGEQGDRAVGKKEGGRGKKKKKWKRKEAEM